MKPKAFLFDMDGVVVDNMRWHAEAWRRFFLGHGIKMDAREFRDKTVGMPTHEVLSYFFNSDFRGGLTVIEI